MSVHELREGGPRRRIPHSRQLPLTDVVIAALQSTLTVPVPFFLAPCMCPPSSHGRSL
jgi:hypothetical protein